MTRRPAAFLTVALVALAAGCGGSDGGGGKSAGELLGYLPDDAPLVAIVDTDTSGEQFKNVDRLLGKFPFGGQVKSQIKQSMQQDGIDYDKDLKPLLGNELVIGSPDARTLVDEAAKNQYVVAWNVKDGEKFKELIKREGDSRESGEVGGETAYESDDGSVVVLKGDTLVGANDRPALEAALEQKDGDGGLTEDKFNAALEGLPDDALVRVYGDAQKLLEADPATATARRVKWVGGLRTFGATATAEGDGVAIDARVNTEGVGEQDLPLAPDDDKQAEVPRERDFGVALRNARQLFHFIENTAKAVDPEGFTQFETGKKAIGAQLGIDVDGDLVEQFTKTTAVVGGVDGTWAVRSEVENPLKMVDTLNQMTEKGRAGDLRFTEAGDDLVLATDEDGDRFYFGIKNGVLVGSQDPKQALAAAELDPQELPDVKASFVAVADGQSIAKQILAAQGGSGALGGQFFTGAVGDVTAWISTSTDGMRAHAKLKIE